MVVLLNKKTSISFPQTTTSERPTYSLLGNKNSVQKSNRYKEKRQYGICACLEEISDKGWSQTIN